MSPVDEAGPSSASILMVDDHPRNLVALEAVLEPLGCRLVSAGSGSEALGWLLREEFALILLDVQMPDLDGFRTAALIKQRAQTRLVPIIFITASGDADEGVLEGYAHGGAAYLRKPFDPEILRAKVAVFVELYLQRKQIERQAALLLERERIIGILGHDLRGPLASILLRTSTLLVGEPLSTDRTCSVQRIAASAKRMGRMIENLVDFTRSRHGGLRLRLEAFDLHQLCRQIVEEIDSTSKRPETTFETSGDCAGYWDPDRLGQVVSNLVSNGITYSLPDTAVLIRIRGSADRVALEVQNTGSPIPPETLATLFDPFKSFAKEKHIDTRSGPTAGLGLGLYIVQEIVRAHQGTVRVSNDATTTSFTVELPRTAMNRSEPPPGASTEHNRLVA